MVEEFVAEALESDRRRSAPIPDARSSLQCRTLTVGVRDPGICIVLSSPTLSSIEVRFAG